MEHNASAVPSGDHELKSRRTCSRSRQKDTEGPWHVAGLGALLCTPSQVLPRDQCLPFDCDQLHVITGAARRRSDAQRAAVVMIATAVGADVGDAWPQSKTGHMGTWDVDSHR